MKTRTALAWMALLSILGCAGGSDQQGDTALPAVASASDFDPCSLLTAEEIHTAVGWTPDSSQKKAYGTTGSCTWFGPNAFTQTVAVLVGQGMPEMSDAQKMADWRAKQYTDMKVNDAVVAPVADLGVPAIRNEFGIVAIEMAVGGQLVSVSSISAKYEQVHQLAAAVLARMK